MLERISQSVYRWIEMHGEARGEAYTWNSYAVDCRDHDVLASYFYLESDGVVPPIQGDGDDVQAFWCNPTRWVDGLTQETCRDNGHHTQYGMGSALHAAEVAWHQGVDLYTAEADRYIATMELMATLSYSRVKCRAPAQTT